MSPLLTIPRRKQLLSGSPPGPAARILIIIMYAMQQQHRLNSNTCYKNKQVEVPMAGVVDKNKSNICVRVCALVHFIIRIVL